MTQEELFYSIFENIPRQGPGTKQSTLKAFSVIKNLPAEAKMLDIGCGKGVQTFDLAEVFHGTITAIDNHPAFVDFVNRKAKGLGLQKRVAAFVVDMNKIPFTENQFDIIWSEGSIFITGFENGLKNWHKFLKEGGYLAVSESAWFRSDLPEEIAGFWNSVYPGIMNMEDQKRVIESCGYQIVESFQEPKEAWKNEYYAYLEPLLLKVSEEHQNNPELTGLLNALQTEIDMYKKYGDYYGYAFYVIRRA